MSTEAELHVLYWILIKQIVYITFGFKTIKTVAVAQWVRTLAPQAKNWVFESQPRQTLNLS